MLDIILGSWYILHKSIRVEEWKNRTEVNLLVKKLPGKKCCTELKLVWNKKTESNESFIHFGATDGTCGRIEKLSWHMLTIIIQSELKFQRDLLENDDR